MQATIAITIAILVLILLIEAFRGMKKSQTLPQFFLMDGGLRLGPFVGTLAATNFSLGNMIFLSLIWGYFYGLGGILWLWIGFVLAALVFVFCVRRFDAFSGYIEEENSGSVHEFLARRYSGDGQVAKPRLIRLAASLTTILCLLIALTLELFLAAAILSPLIGLDPVVVFIALTVLISLYSAIGGFYAVVLTDIVQGVMLVLALVALAVVFWQLGLPSAPSSELYATSFIDILKAPGAFGIFSILAVTLGWYLVTMDTWQRASASRSARVAVRGMVFGTGLLLVGILAFGLIGMYDQLVVLPNLTQALAGAHSGGFNPIADLYLLLDQMPELGRLLMAFVAVAFVMAGVSTADTFLIVSGHSLVSDLLVGLGRNESFASIPGRESVLFASVARSVVVFMGLFVLMMYAVMQWLGLLTNPLAIFYLAYSIQFALLAPVVGALLRSRPRAEYALAALVAGIVSAVGWGFGFALAGVQGVTTIWGHAIDEWVYLAPLPPMAVGFSILLVGWLWGRRTRVSVVSAEGGS